ncbi:MAG: Nif3-like dinuclear metal center hexameric protein, partial [Desulfovibrio sp.]|nr:Nif3-like dinuclear metal center hexameric protein [Desulfovibrio sp.]
AVALDPTPATVGEALARGAECILTHHPLSLSPKLPSELDSYHEVLSLLFRADVPLYASHTATDVQPDGPAGWLARELCLVHPRLLEPTGEGIGFGLAGDMPEKVSFPELLQKLSRRISLETATVCGPVPETVGRLAYCTGSGSSLLAEAEASGADVFVTGDVKYHTALGTRICILDVGHHSLEEEMMRIAGEMLARRLPEVDVFFVPSASPFRRAVES